MKQGKKQGIRFRSCISPLPFTTKEGPVLLDKLSSQIMFTLDSSTLQSPYIPSWRSKGQLCLYLHHKSMSIVFGQQHNL